MPAAWVGKLYYVHSFGDRDDAGEKLYKERKKKTD